MNIAKFGHTRGVRRLSLFLALAMLISVTMALKQPAAAATKGALLPDVVMQPSRFSGPGVYTGTPALQLTLSMIEAGNGPQQFDTIALLKDLSGSKFDAEVAKLTKQYGKTKVDSFVTIFPFIVSDSLKIAGQQHVALPKTPAPDPHNGPALAQALWQAGQTGSGFNVEVLLDRLVSHPIHDRVMIDVDQKYGVAKDADYHAILSTAMNDLATAYNLH